MVPSYNVNSFFRLSFNCEFLPVQGPSCCVNHILGCLLKLGILCDSWVIFLSIGGIFHVQFLLVPPRFLGVSGVGLPSPVLEESPSPGETFGGVSTEVVFPQISRPVAFRERGFFLRGCFWTTWGLLTSLRRPISRRLGLNPPALCMSPHWGETPFC